MVVGSVLAAAHGWRAMFAICGLAGLALVAAILVTMREPARTEPGAHRLTPPAGLSASFRTLARTPGLAWLALGYGASNMMLAVLPTWAPAFLLRSHGVPLAKVGAVIGPAAVVGGIAGTILAGMLATRLIARTGSRCAGLTVPIVALPFAVLAFALFLFAPTIPLLVGIASDALAPSLGGEALRYALCLMLVAPVAAADLLWIARRRIARSAGTA